jgi:hypothetical protein
VDVVGSLLGWIAIILLIVNLDIDHHSSTIQSAKMKLSSIPAMKIGTSIISLASVVAATAVSNAPVVDLGYALHKATISAVTPPKFPIPPNTNRERKTPSITHFPTFDTPLLLSAPFDFQPLNHP